MKRTVLLLFFWLLAFQTPLFGQDVHWSQFMHNPIYLNPALTGNFDADLRLTGNFRDQWRSVTTPFSTISIAADTKIQKYKNLGLGLIFLHDQAGDGKFRTIQFMPSISYKLKLTADSTNIIRFGLQTGILARSLDYTKFGFDNQYQNGIYDPNNPTGETFGADRKTNLIVNFGTTYHRIISKQLRLETGIGLFNINKPNQGLFTTKQNRPRRLGIHSQLEYRYHSELFITPGIQLNFQDKYKSLIIGGNAKYILINKLGKYRAVHFGLWTRLKDATWLHAGVEYQQTFVGISYDINYSKLTPASRLRGGIELSIRHLFIKFRPNKAIHRVCPDYI